SFGRGYGEENDFCMRAAARGWRHLAAANVFVWHWGGRSFGAEPRQRLAQAMRTLRRPHPDYHPRVAGVIARDPLAPARRALDLARLRAQASRYCLLAGGAAAGAEAGRGLLRLERAGVPGRRRWRIAHDQFGALPNLPDIALRDP